MPLISDTYIKLPVNQQERLDWEWMEKYIKSLPFDGYTVEMIDMFNDEFNALPSDAYYKWSMSDAIHPYKMAYLQWWTPYFDDFPCVRLG